ncbi:MAG: phosphoglucosamine mutase, partial [Euryarchaeota archaeon]|nr:phosphoglucosamine mutase [Euryarchaeota archaeon]
MKLFGTNGVRGKIGETFTPEFLVKIGAAIGTYLPEGATVIVGSDTRVSGAMVKSAVLSGLLAAGVNAVDIGVAPTPAVQLYTKNHGDFGIVITASHNPPEFNGVKAVAGDGTELPREEEEKIEDIFFSGKFRTVSWKEVGQYTTRGGAGDEYIARILSLINVEKIRARKFKVVLDCANGAACGTSPYLLEKLGAKLTTLNCQPDGTFPGHESEPKPENLKTLIEFMRTGEFDLGIAHDGDADRVVFV